MTVTHSKVMPAINAVVGALQSGRYFPDFLVRGSFVTRFLMGPYARLCQDLDLLYLHNWNRDRVVAVIGELLREASAEQLQFDPDSLQVRDIWENSLSPGLRVTVDFVYGNETRELQIDVAGNDPLVAEPIVIDVPVENTGEDPVATPQTLKVKTVVPEILAAWKLHGLFEHLSGAWMTKTLWDLYVLCRYNELDRALFARAIEVAFSSRLDPPVIMRRFLYGDFGRSASSRRGWESEIAQYAGGEQPAMSTILDWLRENLAPILNIENDQTLLTNTDVVAYRVNWLREQGDEKALLKLKALNQKTRVLPYKAYHSIPHLPGSRGGNRDRYTDDNKVRMLTSEKLRPEDIVIVREKLDGSCVCAWRRNDVILPLGRDGDLAAESPNESRRLWSEWVLQHEERFRALLAEGERVCGEWLALVHGTKYRLSHEPFVVFDIFNTDNHMISQAEVERRCEDAGFVMPHKLHEGEPVSIEHVIEKLGKGFHGALDQPEGAVWRLERHGRSGAWSVTAGHCLLPSMSIRTRSMAATCRKTAGGTRYGTGTRTGNPGL